MPLPIGSWSINLEGAIGQLVISAVDAAGKVTGTLNGTSIFGFWTETSQRLTFWSGTRVFTANLFADVFRMPGVTGANVHTLAGSSTVTPTATLATAATVRRPTSGWYAQIGTT